MMVVRKRGKFEMVTNANVTGEAAHDTHEDP